MKFKVVILKRANLEIEDAYLYYENIQDGLGINFILDYEDHLNTLYNIPFFKKRYSAIRILPLKKFPYSIHFSVDEINSIVTVHAVILDYQNPDLTRIKL